MPVETPSVFAKVIEDHLRLKARNSQLEDTHPIDRYRNEDPFQNHPLFKTEEQARLEETMDGHASIDEADALMWPGEETGEVELTEAEESLWGRSRDFDWGD